MRVQVIKNLCDWCNDEGTEEDAEVTEYPLTVGTRSVILDLCKFHREALDGAPVIQSVFAIGRVPDKITRKPRAPRAIDPEEVGIMWPCTVPGCTRGPFPKRQGLAMHLTRAHTSAERAQAEPMENLAANLAASRE